MGNAEKTNRAWLMTAPGSAAIAVVRIAGPGVATFLFDCFSRPISADRCIHGELIDPQTNLLIDDPIAILGTDRASADICLHGGPWITQSALRLLALRGFKVQPTISLPLDDTLIDGAESLLQKEMLSHLPLAKTELALRMLLNQPVAWARAMDHAIDRDALLSDRTLSWLLHQPRVAIVGLPNVGKSTLANQLFAQKRAITADLPGTTRDWIGETANIDGLAITLVDTPGLRNTNDPIEQAAIIASGQAVNESDMIVLVLDATLPLAGEQAALLARWPDALVVMNKIDQPGKLTESVTAIECNALTGTGVDAIRAAIRARFVQHADEITRPRCWTMRQRELIESAGMKECADAKLVAAMIG